MSRNQLAKGVLFNKIANRLFVSDVKVLGYVHSDLVMAVVDGKSESICRVEISVRGRVAGRNAPESCSLDGRSSVH